MRQLLKNARIYDGTGSEPYASDILVEDDRIAKISAISRIRRTTSST